jgi:signal transduction histidine kinase
VKSLQKDASEINECLALATEISDEIRTLSYVLHPPMLDELGLIGAVHVYVEGINKRQIMRVELEVASELGQLTKEVEIALFRVVQAALANVHSHSGSNRATIRINQDTEKLTLEIIDRGHGFTSKAQKRGNRCGQVVSACWV